LPMLAAVGRRFSSFWMGFPPEGPLYIWEAILRDEDKIASKDSELVLGFLSCATMVV
jgi:hypothetical protein